MGAAVGVLAPGLVSVAAPIPPALSGTTVLTAGPAQAPGIDEFDVCGQGRRKGVMERVQAAFSGSDAASASAADNDAQSLELPPDLGQAALAKAWPELVARLAASPEPRLQAAAWRMAGHPPGGDLLAITGVPAQGALINLARLALSSSDPLVMQWAVRACSQKPSVAAACGGLSARHWVRLAPDNGTAWLELLDQEPAALEEALHGLSQARRLDSAWGQLPFLVDQALPADWPATLRVLIQSPLIALDSAQGTVSFSALRKACNAQSLAQVNRRLQCDAIAALMIGESRDLLGAGVGLGLAKGLGWPASKLAALRADHEALIRAGSSSQADLAQPYSCQALSRHRQKQAGVAALGERGWLRQQAALQR